MPASERRQGRHELIPFGVGFHVAFTEPSFLNAVDTKAGTCRSPDKRFEAVGTVDNHGAPIMLNSQQFADNVEQIFEAFNCAGVAISISDGGRSPSVAR